MRENISLDALRERGSSNETPAEAIDNVRAETSTLTNTLLRN